MRILMRWSAVLLALLAVMTSGCGGGGSSPTGSGNSSAPSGRLILTIKFPPAVAGRQIPIGSNAVKVQLVDPSSGTDLAPAQVIARPSSSNTVTVNFPLVRAGPIRVIATAYADVAATQPLGMGQVDGVVQAGMTTTLNVPLTLGPVDHVTVTPTSLSLIAPPPAPSRQKLPGPAIPAILRRIFPRSAPSRSRQQPGVSSATLTAAVFDASNMQLLGFPIVWSSNNPAVATVTADPSNSTVAAVQAIGPGDAVITATEPNSGKSATANVHVSGFRSTANMTAARRNHTATLLNDGTVLIAGGSDASGNALSSAEIYNPATGTFTPTAGSMSAARIGHTATLLQNGDVLITGGLNTSGTSLGTAELYHPPSGMFTLLTSFMTTSRAFQTATLLQNGMVLIAGGVLSSVDGSFSLSSAELYDPVKMGFSSTGSMRDARSLHASVLLADGTVLELGGENVYPSPVAIASIEHYDPVTGMFSVAGSLNKARSSLTATLLPNGNVLAAGGDDPSTGVTLPDAEVFNPGTGTVIATAMMLTPRSGHTATLLPNGTVLLAGGNTATAEIYVPASNTFADAGDLTTVRTFHTATLLPDGTVLIAGGANGIQPALQTAEIYHP